MTWLEPGRFFFFDWLTLRQRSKGTNQRHVHKKLHSEWQLPWGDSSVPSKSIIRPDAYIDNGPGTVSATTATNLVKGPLLAFDLAIYDKPFNDGRYLCNVLGCPKSFTRKADRDRHVQSWHNCATLHFCPVPRCKKSLGKPYSRKDKLQEHMRTKHLTQPRA
jgi:hypothetical protein